MSRARKALGAGSEVATEAGAAAHRELRSCLLRLVQAGEYPNALSVAREANRLFPAEAQSGFDLGAVLILSKGDPAAARAVLEESLRRPGRFTKTDPSEQALALNNLGKLALARGDGKEARRFFDEGLRLDGENSVLLYNAAASDFKLKDAAAAVDHFRKAHAVAPEQATRDDVLIGAWALNQSDKPTEAAALLRDAIARMPNESGLHLNLGWSLAMEGKPVEALLEYLYELENGSETDEYAKEARLEFLDGLARARATPLFSASIEALRIAFSGVSPPNILVSLRSLDEAGYRHPTLDLLRAEALRAAGQVREAEEGLRKLLESDPALLPTYFDLSSILHDSGRKAEARLLVAEAVRRNPAHWQLIGKTSAAR